MSGISNCFKKIYKKVFCRTQFYSLNKRIYYLSLNGMGILNYENGNESGEKFFLNRLSMLIGNKEPVVFDVGANIGNYSEQVIKNIPKAQVYAFEPHPVTFKRLQEKSRDIGYTAFNVGCSNHRGSAKFYDYKTNDGSTHASLYKDVIEIIHGGESIERILDFITLDDFIIERSITRVNLLKIDTEGNELKVIEGCTNAINNGIIDVIHFEFNEMNVISKVFFKDFYEILPQYDFYRMLPNGLIRLKQYSPLECEIFAFQNIVAVRKDCLFNLTK